MFYDIKPTLFALFLEQLLEDTILGRIDLKNLVNITVSKRNKI